MRSLVRQIAAGALAAGLDIVSAAAAELIMVEEAGCPWCARFDAEIAPIYPKTPEAGTAPLRRIPLRGPHPDDLEFAAPLRVTPTFVLVEDGVELTRIEGYPGEALFWPMLTRMLQELETE